MEAVAHHLYDQCHRHPVHMAIDLYVTGDGTAMTPRYAFHVITGIVVMMILYFLDYTLLARFSK